MCQDMKLSENVLRVLLVGVESLGNVSIEIWVVRIRRIEMGKSSTTDAI